MPNATQGVPPAPGGAWSVSPDPGGPLVSGSTPAIEPPSAADASPPAVAQRDQQLSGVSGDGAADGSFGRWRGSAVTIGGTWDDSYEAQVGLWSVIPGGQWADWQYDLDIAIGAIYQQRGETWARAAAGEYDARWAAALGDLAQIWADRPGILHIRFAHEFNGKWTPWAVTGDQAADFVTAWRRFRALQTELISTAKLVFCPNDQTSKSLDLDWRAAFPGSEYVDEMAVDSYNQYPYLDTAEMFEWKTNRYDAHGAPLGVESHRRFAESVGLPMAVAEWGTNSDEGDGEAYMRLFAAWLHRNAGSGPGQIPYEILFNVGEFADGRFHLFPTTRTPKAAAAYLAEF